VQAFSQYERGRGSGRESERGRETFPFAGETEGEGGEVSLKRETQHEGERVDSGERECGDLLNTHQVG
jgi:hypothetical protein